MCRGFKSLLRYHYPRTATLSTMIRQYQRHDPYIRRRALGPRPKQGCRNLRPPPHHRSRSSQCRPSPRTVAEILRTVDGPGDFRRRHDRSAAPRLEVDGVGPLALPVLPAQAAQLVAAAERAPYGRGAETVIDTTVRRTWQIAPERVHIRGKQWPQALRGNSRACCRGLRAGKTDHGRTLQAAGL